MTRLVLSMTMSLDGFFSGPGGEMDWMTQAPDPEFSRDNVSSFDRFAPVSSAVNRRLCYRRFDTSEINQPRIADSHGESLCRWHHVRLRVRDERPMEERAPRPRLGL
jgi:hypothetical protein